MVYNTFKRALFLRVFILFLTLMALAYSVFALDFNLNPSLKHLLSACFLALSILSFLNLLNFMSKRFSEIDDFFESIKYKDFSRWFNEDTGAPDIKKLHKNFNAVTKTIIQINKEKEEQHLYLKKILELIQTGIIAYNIETGHVLWGNDAFKTILNVPSLKTVNFIKNRKPELFKLIFTNHYTTDDNITLNIENEDVKLLISTSIFEIKDQRFKLIVLQNIDATLNKNESEAWKKLLSVMTHEIMNSIAPISSLAETLQSQILAAIDTPETATLDITDLSTGIESIKSRSEGLLKFAKTYRSLNKINTLNLSKVNVSALFSSLKTLMLPSLVEKNMTLICNIENPNLEIDVDNYLIEQVLLNLILNAIEALEKTKTPTITLLAKTHIDGSTTLSVADNGKGIPKEISNDIFVPFFTTKTTGSGIGLSLCKQIMLLHKGKITVKSTPNTGTVIALHFKKTAHPAN